MLGSSAFKPLTSGSTIKQQIALQSLQRGNVQGHHVEVLAGAERLFSFEIHMDLLGTCKGMCSAVSTGLESVSLKSRRTLFSEKASFPGKSNGTS